MLRLGLLALLLCAACAPGFHPVPAPPPPLTLDADSAGQRFDIAVGQEASVRLEANPSTGYSWALADSHSAVMAVVGEPRYQPPARTLPGAPGTQTWTLKAMAQGEETVVFEYRRPWEKGAPAARSVALTFLAR